MRPESPAGPSHPLAGYGRWRRLRAQGVPVTEQEVRQMILIRALGRLADALAPVPHETVRRRLGL